MTEILDSSVTVQSSHRSSDVFSLVYMIIDMAFVLLSLTAPRSSTGGSWHEPLHVPYNTRTFMTGLWSKFVRSRNQNRDTYLICFFFIILSEVRLSSLGTAATTGLLYQPQMIYDADCGAIGGMKIGRGNRSTRRNPAPEPLRPHQIPHDQTRARTRAAAVVSQPLTAWAMARPNISD
jgi:hypothetical protein